MKPIQLSEVRKDMIILEEDSYGDNIYIAKSDFQIFNDSDKLLNNFPGFIAEFIDGSGEILIGGHHPYEPTLFLMEHPID